MVSTRSAHTPQDIENGAASVAQYLDWCRDILQTFDFGTPQRRHIWSMLADGKRYAEIQAALDVSRQEIARTVDEVWAKSELPPVPNPWRKSGRKELKMGAAS